MKAELKKKKTGKKIVKWHKWAGLIFSFFLIMFSVSGIFLNHRKEIASLDVSRSLLPASFQYKNWNNAAAKGSLRIKPDSILLYGGAGIFISDTAATDFRPFNNGIKNGADNQIIGGIKKTENGEVFAISTFDLYRLNQTNNNWINQSSLIDTDERLSDLQIKGDTLVLLSRSHLFISAPPYHHFTKIELEAPFGYKKEASLFRTMWTLHSGELFGLPGKVFVDLLGIITIILCITGIIITFFPKLIKKRKRKKKENKSFSNTLKTSHKLHNKIGVSLLIFLAILFLSGSFLRPPLLITIIREKVRTIPGTVLNSSNPWFDKLRCIRYDNTANEWILYSSDGFFRFPALNSIPKKLQSPPPVSVMGVNILEQKDSIWIVGSFSGLFYRDRATGKSIDAFTLKPAKVQRGGPPVFTNAVSGYSDDFATGEIVFDYSAGARRLTPGNSFPEMPPDAIKNSRMSLWHLSLEVHTGRIYLPQVGLFSDLFTFFAGILSLSILISGYIVYRRRHKNKHKPSHSTTPKIR